MSDRIGRYKVGDLVTLSSYGKSTNQNSCVTEAIEDGYCVYINKSSKGTSYRIGTPSKAIVAAGLMALEGQAYA